MHSLNDYSVFTKRSGASLVILAVYVDDIILIGTDLSEIFALKSFLHDQFKIKDLDEFHSLECTLITCLLELNVKLKAKKGELLPKPEEYRSLLGKLIFLTHIRPDLSFAVQHLSQFMQQPCIPHMKAALHLLRYLKGSADSGIFYNNDPAMSLQVFCDNDWASYPDSRRSVTGFCIFLGGSLVGWKSKKQHVVSLSSAEAEYRAMSKAVTEVTWLSRLLSDFGVLLSSYVPVFCDSQVALHCKKSCLS
ncbi:secreted RxLR effector protein 161-like [Nicotiana sylvestris]|uniref:secreted RxLR effector protein 161-like n=1 Tax=Nicotiana sylvestris TaxID=4096 RepID=UPI00388C4276